ncbi:MAG: PIG-L family deacetylase [Actinomycetota bacterium]|nr:PIG-L family deacetylase [Actinomycetota bacterium]
MTQLRPRSLPGLPRKLYRGLKARRRRREESTFKTSMRADPAAAELVLSPHWDDAVLDCWSLLSSERELNVVNIFAGVPAPGRLTSWDATTGASDSAERARERISEDALALGRAGRAPLNLTLLDAQYRPVPGALGLRDLERALTDHVQSASRVYVPAGIGGHTDHVLTRRYGRTLLRAGIPVTLYADLPYCILHGWPSWVDGREPEPNRNVDAFWRSYLDAVPELGPLRSATVERLDADAAGAKLQALLCYQTQVPCLSYGARGLLADPAIHGFEVRWELGGNGSGPARAATDGR